MRPHCSFKDLREFAPTCFHHFVKILQGLSCLFFDAPLHYITRAGIERNATRKEEEWGSRDSL
jgi:hypothetical protein